jgi:hypothetical protein
MVNPRFKLLIHRPSPCQRALQPATRDLTTFSPNILTETCIGYRLRASEEEQVGKFNAAWRRDAYKHKDVAEQKAMLEKIESGFDFRPAELMGVLQSALNCQFSGISIRARGCPVSSTNSTVTSRALATPTPPRS